MYNFRSEFPQHIYSVLALGVIKSDIVMYKECPINSNTKINV